MPIKIDGQVYYRTAEVCQIVGIGKSTLFRWIKQDIVKDAEYRDRKGWRLFAEDSVVKASGLLGKRNGTL
ncbi:MAG: hypothetical protein ABSF21_06340 [Dehalococcoidia bacterium]